MSPPTAGSSTLMTSAPMSDKKSVPNGPAPYCSTALTRTPRSGASSTVASASCLVDARNRVRPHLQAEPAVGRGHDRRRVAELLWVSDRLRGRFIVELADPEVGDLERADGGNLRSRREVREDDVSHIVLSESEAVDQQRLARLHVDQLPCLQVGQVAEDVINGKHAAGAGGELLGHRRSPIDLQHTSPAARLVVGNRGDSTRGQVLHADSGPARPEE